MAALDAVRRQGQPARQRGRTVFPVLSALALMLTIDHAQRHLARAQPADRSRACSVCWAAATRPAGAGRGGLSLTSPCCRPPGHRLRAARRPEPCCSAPSVSLLAAGMAFMFTTCPTPVRWRHAIAGGCSCPVGFEVAKGLAGTSQVPTFAVVWRLRHAAHPAGLDLPRLGDRAARRGDRRLRANLQMHVARWPDRPGSRFNLRWRCCRRARAGAPRRARGLDLAELSQALRVDPLQAGPSSTRWWDGLAGAPGRTRLGALRAAGRSGGHAGPRCWRRCCSNHAHAARFRERAGFDRLTLAELSTVRRRIAGQPMLSRLAPPSAACSL